jgi:monofunctional chorismate mutase
MEAKEQLLKYREEIDRIDSEILSLLLKRREIAMRIGEVKRILGYPIFDAERERELLDRLQEKVQTSGNWDGKDLNEACQDVAAVFREILAASRRAQQGGCC